MNWISLKINLFDIHLDGVIDWLSILEVEVNYNYTYYLLYIDKKHIEVLGINKERLMKAYEKIKRQKSST